MKKAIKKSRTSCNLYDSKLTPKDKLNTFIIADFAEKCKRGGTPMPENAINDKIQTGLRLPISRYRQLAILAEEIGVSINALILMLIDLGLSLRFVWISDLDITVGGKP